VANNPQLQDCQVCGVVPERPGKLNSPPFYALQVGAVNHRKYIVDPEERRRLGLFPTRKRNPYNRVPRQLVGQFTKVGLEPKKELQEFRVTKDALLPIGEPGFALAS
jgi:ribosomal protein L3